LKGKSFLRTRGKVFKVLLKQGLESRNPKRDSLGVAKTRPCVLSSFPANG
jgi:hypothetical protein